ncbi:histidine phosphatase superfamily [Cryomyces antarcticus]
MAQISCFVALLAAVVLTPLSTAQTTYTHTVHSSVVVLRTGERSPRQLGNLRTALTSHGAQQAYDAGTSFRARYIAQNSSARIYGLNELSLDNAEFYAMCLDLQYTSASAQAFIQGLYPPYTINNTATVMLDSPSVYNSTFIEAPLGGYQYAQIHSVSLLEPNIVYLDGSSPMTGNCPRYLVSGSEYYSTSEFSTTDRSSKQLYNSVGPSLLADVLPPKEWDYSNAYDIYDYLSYQNAHNASASRHLSDIGNNNGQGSILSQLQWLADQEQFALNGNLAASLSSDPSTTAGIRAIAGRTLAAKILGLLFTNVVTEGEYYKLSLLVTEFEPLLSFFALASLPALNSNFRGLPAFASALVFELFSATPNDTSATAYPPVDQLWVRFSFRNGSDPSPSPSTLQAYPLFGRGPSQTDIPWTEFVSAIEDIAVGKIGDWCNACASLAVFCAGFNASLSSTIGAGASSSSSSSAARRSRWPVTPPIAGLIGAIVALVVALAATAAIARLAGLRVHRVPPRGARAPDLAGFRGAAKMPSDADLTVPQKVKGGAGISVESTPRERVGSWELKGVKEEARFASLRRPSFEDDGALDLGREAVKPDERV